MLPYRGSQAGFSSVGKRGCMRHWEIQGPLSPLPNPSLTLADKAKVMRAEAIMHGGQGQCAVCQEVVPGSTTEDGQVGHSQVRAHDRR